VTSGCAVVIHALEDRFSRSVSAVIGPADSERREEGDIVLIAELVAIDGDIGVLLEELRHVLEYGHKAAAVDAVGDEEEHEDATMSRR
jgi:hypothetical protein